MLVGHRDGTVGGEGHLTGDHLEEADAGAVDIGTRIGVAALDMLGAEVGDGADDHALRGGGVVGHRTRQPEVGDLHAPVIRDEDVLGLDIAMHEACVVRGGEGFENRVEHGECLLGGERAVVAQDIAQGAPGDVLHGEVGDPGRLALVEDSDDVGVAQLRRRPGLAAEAGDEARVLGEGCAHHLEGDGAVQAGVDGFVDGGHAASGDARHHLVAAVHEGPDEGIGGAGLPGGARRGGAAAPVGLGLAGRGLHDGPSLGRQDAPGGDARIRRGRPGA